MLVTEVNITYINSKKNDFFKGKTSIVLDNSFRIHEIRIIEGKDGHYIEMPKRKTSKGYIDIANPLDNSTRIMIENAVLDQYEKILNEQVENS